jgi:hypothetical protein
MNVLIYCRVSTEIQSLSSQEDLIKQISKDKNWNVIDLISEKCSGFNNKREGLVKLKKNIQSKKIDTIVCTELSRLSRDKDFTLKLIGRLKELNIDIFITSKDKFLSEISDIEIIRLVDFSNIESKEIRERLQRGYQHFRDSGGKVGRKDGWIKSIDTILSENKTIQKLLLKGFSVREIMDITKKSSGLIMKVRKELKVNNMI